MAFHEGIYNSALVTATVGAPVGIGGLSVAIPGLPQGVTFPLTVVGRQADSFFSVTNAVDAVAVVVGAEGNATHVINPDESGTLTVNLTGGSVANLALGILFRTQRRIGSGQVPAFTFPVSYRDNNSTPPETHVGLNCLILRQPDVEFGASTRTVAWGFVATQIISQFSSRVSVP